MCFGGGTQKVTQVNKTELTPEQTKLIGTGMSLIDPAVDKVKGGQITMPQVPGFDPLQTQGQQGVLNTAQGGMFAPDLSSAQSFLLGNVMDLNSNPALMQALQGTIRPITEQFTQSVLPGVRANAIHAGALGSSRNDIANSLVTQDFLRQVGDTSAKFMSDAYGQNLEALVKGVALTPQSQQAALMPSLATEAVGAQRRQLGQEQALGGLQSQLFPFMLGQQLLGSSAGIPGAGSTSTVAGAQPSASLGQTLLGAGSAAAGIANLLPSLMALSSRDAKESVELVSREDAVERVNALQIYDYKYKRELVEALGLPERRRGPMAEPDKVMIDVATIVADLVAAVQALTARLDDLEEEKQNGQSLRDPNGSSSARG